MEVVIAVIKNVDETSHEVTVIILKCDVKMTFEYIRYLIHVNLVKEHSFITKLLRTNSLFEHVARINCSCIKDLIKVMYCSPIQAR